MQDFTTCTVCTTHQPTPTAILHFIPKVSCDNEIHSQTLEGKHLRSEVRFSDRTARPGIDGIHVLLKGS